MPVYQYHTDQRDNCDCVYCSYEKMREMFNGRNSGGGYTQVVYETEYNVIHSRHTYGVEIECVIPSKDAQRITGHDREEVASKVVPFWKLTSDGSLRKTIDSDIPLEFQSEILLGDIGVEILDDFFRIIKPKFNATCGQHIHMSLNARDKSLSPEFTENVGILAPWWDAVVITPHLPPKRKNTQWAKPVVANCYRVGTSTFNRYCNLQEVKLAARSMYDCMNTHYSSISITSRGTVEFRHLHGQSDSKFLIRMINTYMAFLDITNSCEFGQLVQFTRRLVGIVSDSVPSIMNNEQNTIYGFLQRARIGTSEPEEQKVIFDIRRRLLSLALKQRLSLKGEQHVS